MANPIPMSTTNHSRARTWQAKLRLRGRGSKFLEGPEQQVAWRVTTLTTWGWFKLPTKTNSWLDLVGGFKHGFYFTFHIWDVIIPTDELIFFRGVGIPPTSIYKIIKIVM